MVLHHIADRARLLVELPPSLHPELLRHGDLDPLDVIAVPDRLQEAVGEPVVQEILHRLLAEVVIDPEDGRLGKELVQRAIERLSGGEVAAERLLHDDAPVDGGTHPSQTGDYGGEEAGRDCQIKERPLAADQRIPQSLVGARILVVSPDKAEQPAQFLKRGRVEGTVLLHAIARSVPKLVQAVVGTGHPHDRHVEMAVTDHRLQGGEDLLEGEVAGNTEDDQCVGGGKGLSHAS
jgi:hypothetical protein